MRIFAKVQYKGTKYFGWQRQPYLVTVQETIENELSKYFNTPITIYGAGRTDAGVHANGQTFHFDVDVDNIDLDRLIYSLNRMLPEDICIDDMEQVDENFHARFSAVGKVYNYLISFESKNPFFYETCYLYPKGFDYSIFEEALKKFEGKHNFKNFTSKEEDQDNFVREIFSIESIKDGTFVGVTFKGNGFMRYMIRFIVGYCIDVANGKYPLESIDELLEENSERHIVSSKAPACGLVLLGVIYNEI